MQMMMHLIVAAASVAFTSAAYVPAVRSAAHTWRHTTICASATPAPVTEAPPLKPPPSREEMLSQAAKAISSAREDGKNRFTLRLFLPRGEDNNLFPPDGAQLLAGVPDLPSARVCSLPPLHPR